MRFNRTLDYAKKDPKPRRTREDFFWPATAFLFMLMCLIIAALLAGLLY